MKDHASEHERLFISASYYGQITHDFNKELEAYQALTQIDPRNRQAAQQTSCIYSNKGEYEKALEEEQEAVRVAPPIYSDPTAL